MNQEKLIVVPHTNITIPMVWVEGGSFMMGGEKYDDEKPIHQVGLDSFWVGKYPITQAQWQAVVAQASALGLAHELNPLPAYFQIPEHPVEQVSWIDCLTWIDLLQTLLKAQNEDIRLHLPTEAQWEYAARGGIHKSPYEYAGADDLHQVAWYDDNSYNTTHAVGLKKPNALGIYDMSGNVREWCLDAWDEEAYKKTPENFKNPVCIEGEMIDSNTIKDNIVSIIKNRANNQSVLRGGSWNDDYGCRTAFRDYFSSPDLRSVNYGLRLYAGL